jgi:hypothetical protein
MKYLSQQIILCLFLVRAISEGEKVAFVNPNSQIKIMHSISELFAALQHLLIGTLIKSRVAVCAFTTKKKISSTIGWFA